MTVYVPEQYQPGSTVPVIIGTDGPDYTLFNVLDNLIDQGRVPVMVAISASNGGGDAYQFSFVRNARHCDPAMKAQLLPQALEYLWLDYAG